MNRLAGETSPYLRQHAGNPVDWYPWGDEAFDLARSTDRPVLVSVGYSACHWCHVMAHESFEDETTAAYLNEHFVSVKVDREERPDIDAVYLEAVQAMTGQGGWPMTVFCAPDGRPFFGGTYFPADERRGRPTFRALLEAISGAWSDRREQVLDQAGSLTGAVEERLALPEPGPLERPSPARVRAAVTGAVRQLRELDDEQFGGFGTAPKFPQAPLLELLLRAHASGHGHGAGGGSPALEVVERALAGMASGGIYDHLGGGFARYSVDEAWQVPHFEKMLYDQAALARVYLHAWQLTGNPDWRQVLGETVAYVLTELREPGGGIHAAEDADSEGEEGLYYLWTIPELEEVLGPDSAGAAARWFGVTERGNFEGRNILHRPIGAPLARPAVIEQARETMALARARRVRPGRDDKVLTEWNAMWCSTLAEAAAATGEIVWAEAALETASFLLRELRRKDGRWMRSWRDGRAAHLAYASDYAWLVDCFVRLAELSGSSSWLDEACKVADALVDLFFVPGEGLYTTGRDAPALVVRPRELHDGVIPSAASVAAVALCRLGALTGDAARRDLASALVASAGQLIDRTPTALPHLLAAAELLAGGSVELVVTGDRQDLVAEARSRYLPSAVLAWGDGTGPLFEGRAEGVAYLCLDGACLLPVTDRGSLAAQLDALTRRTGAGASTEGVRP